MHIIGKDSWLKHLDFIILDILTLALSFVIAYIIRYQSFDFISMSGWMAGVVIIMLLDILIILFGNTYSGVLRRHGSEEFLSAVIQALYGFVLACILLFVLGIGASYSRWVIVFTYTIYIILSLIVRTVWKSLLLKGRIRSFNNIEKTMLVVGNRDNIEDLLANINDGFFKEYDVKGVFVTDTSRGDSTDDSYSSIPEYIQGFEVHTDLDKIAEFAAAENINEVFVGIAPDAITKENYQTLIANGIGVHLDIESMIGFETDDQFVTRIGIFRTLSVGVYTFSGRQMVYLAVKRICDIIFGLIGCIGIGLVAIIVKISYLLSGDTKSIFYTHTRIGQNGKPFKMYKFRSMIPNADEVLKELLKDPEYKRQWDENQKFDDDPRITKMGHILRKTSLDEVPQFINLLKGDMSLIGPRPLVPGELEAHGGLKLYQQVKPGIAGWWACHGRSNVSYRERLDMEYYYVKNCSLYMDALCIVKTVAAVVKRDGAV